jgi:hypothetical protein
MEGYPIRGEGIPVESKTSLASRCAGFPVPSERAARTALGAVIATAVALAALVAIGVIS